MAKNLKADIGDLGNWYAMTNAGLSYIEGELLTLIESLGLQEKQQEAVKSILRRTYWNSIRENSCELNSDEIRGPWMRRWGINKSESR